MYDATGVTPHFTPQITPQTLQILIGLPQKDAVFLWEEEKKSVKNNRFSTENLLKLPLCCDDGGATRI